MTQFVTEKFVVAMGSVVQLQLLIVLRVVRLETGKLGKLIQNSLSQQ